MHQIVNKNVILNGIMQKVVNIKFVLKNKLAKMLLIIIMFHLKIIHNV